LSQKSIHSARKSNDDEVLAKEGEMNSILELPSRTLPVRAWAAWKARGSRYALHKILRRTLTGRPALKRRFLYRDPQEYWTLRGGYDYFREQEGQPNRTLRARWIAERIASYGPSSILEIGCGYGKVIAELRKLLPAATIVGLDFSKTQLEQAWDYLGPSSNVSLILGSGEHLPFPDRSFDLVMTSAVILHNPPPAAERIRREVIRVARFQAAHNEETNTSYNRYGYDTAAWYRERQIRLIESRPIPMDPDPTTSQFCVAEFGNDR
jgi:SAM-dependent methyltransferase